MKSASGPYMQKAGRGNMEKTGRGIPQEFKGPHQEETEGTWTDPAKGLNRSRSSYQPKYEANVIGPATEITPPSQYQNPNTGQYAPLVYNVATAEGNEERTKWITANSQKVARERTNEEVAKQKTFAKGKMVFNADGSLKKDFSDVQSGSLRQRAREGGMRIDNIDQPRLMSRITQARNTGNWGGNGGGGMGAVSLTDQIYDIHRRDSTNVSNMNRTTKQNREYERDAQTVQRLGANMYKKKK